MKSWFWNISMEIRSVWLGLSYIKFWNKNDFFSLRLKYDLRKINKNKTFLDFEYDRRWFLHDSWQTNINKQEKKDAALILNSCSNTNFFLRCFIIDTINSFDENFDITGQLDVWQSRKHGYWAEFISFCTFFESTIA